MRATVAARDTQPLANLSVSQAFPTQQRASGWVWSRRGDLDTGEILALVEGCLTARNEIAGVRDAAMIGLIYTCGLRRAEVVALSMADVDLESGAIRVLHGKGGKQRVVYAAGYKGRRKRLLAA